VTQPDEQVLAEGGVTRVVRLGDTVRRPVRPFTGTVQSFLRHLRAQGVEFVPEPLGYDDQGREVLRFVPGDVPLEPLPNWATTKPFSPNWLASSAYCTMPQQDGLRHVTRYGAASQAFLPWSWPPLFDAPELVSHQDYCPGNVVFREGLPKAFIDFDLARPTTRVADCVNALYWWVPLLHPADRPPSLAGADAGHRVRVSDAYGMSHEQRAQVLPVAVRRASNTHVTMRAAAGVDPVFRRWWDEGVKDRMPRAEAWLDAEGAAIEAALLRAP